MKKVMFVAALSLFAPSAYGEDRLAYGIAAGVIASSMIINGEKHSPRYDGQYYDYDYRYRGYRDENSSIVIPYVFRNETVCVPLTHVVQDLKYGFRIEKQYRCF